MSSFNKDLNSSNQFIIAIKVVKSPKAEEYSNGRALQLIINANSKRALIDTGAPILVYLKNVQMNWA